MNPPDRMTLTLQRVPGGLVLRIAEVPQWTRVTRGGLPLLGAIDDAWQQVQQADYARARGMLPEPEAHDLLATAVAGQLGQVDDGPHDIPAAYAGRPTAALRHVQANEGQLRLRAGHDEHTMPAGWNAAERARLRRARRWKFNRDGSAVGPSGRCWPADSTTVRAVKDTLTRAGEWPR